MLRPPRIPPSIAALRLGLEAARNSVAPKGERAYGRNSEEIFASVRQGIGPTLILNGLRSRLWERNEVSWR
jgi:hypothetical protein